MCSFPADLQIVVLLFLQLFIMTLKSRIVTLESLDFAEKIVLVCFGMRIVDAIKIASKTPATLSRSDTIALEIRKG